MQCITLGEEDGGEAEEVDGEMGQGAVSLEQEMAQAQGRAKAQAAQSFTRAINLQSRGVGMRVDPTLFAVKQRANLMSSAYFAALVAAKGGTSSMSALVAASGVVMEAAKGAGLYVAGVPPSLAARGGYSAMDAGFDGFGAGGGLTWRRLRSILQSRGVQ